jgi:SAM-dependent methyltransferase
MERNSPPDFQEYLEAKRLVDLQCLNRSVLTDFVTRIESLRDPSILDLGTGTGLIIRKLAEMQLKGDAYIAGVDIDQRSCHAAVSLIEDDITHTGFRRVEKDRQKDPCSCGFIRAQSGGLQLCIDIRIGDALAPGTPWLPGDAAFDAVTANSFLDLMPLKDIVMVIRGLLKPGGLLYATINYDGMTTLLPLSSDTEFEADLLDNYNRSMDMRRIRGKVSGGSRTGSRLFGVLIEEGFALLKWGCSDWIVVPEQGRYKRGEEIFLRAIIRMIYDEGLKGGRLKREKLDRWLSERVAALEDGRLAFMNHQIDVLAAKEL